MYYLPHDEKVKEVSEMRSKASKAKKLQDKFEKNKMVIRANRTTWVIPKKVKPVEEIKSNYITDNYFKMYYGRKI